MTKGQGPFLANEAREQVAQKAATGRFPTAGDIFGRIDEMLDDEDVGVVSPFGLRTDDLHHSHDDGGEVGGMDAMQAYCFAFRRDRLPGEERTDLLASERAMA